MRGEGECRSLASTLGVCFLTFPAFVNDPCDPGINYTYLTQFSVDVVIVLLLFLLFKYILESAQLKGNIDIISVDNKVVNFQRRGSWGIIGFSGVEVEFRKV